MDEEDKARVTKITGFAIGIFAIFTLLAVLSYLFTWKADQSALASAVGDVSVEVKNIAGKAGYKWAELLVCRWFGLGSIALIIILFAMAARLILHRWHYSMTKTILLTVSGALVSSFVLAFISNLLGLSNAFGGGLGGLCGAAVVKWSSTVVGDILTALILLFLVVLWLFFASRKFSHWLAGLGERRAERKEAKQEGAEENIQEEGSEDEDIAEVVERRGYVPQPAASDGARTLNDTFAGKSGGGAAQTLNDSIAQSAEDGSAQQSNASSAGSSNVGNVTDNKSVAAQSETKVSGSSADGGDAADENASVEITRDDSLTTKVTEELPRIDVRDELPDYEFPSLELLSTHESSAHVVPDAEIMRNNNKIRATLQNYKIQVVDVQAIVGPTVTLYKVYPAPGVKISEIKKLQEDIGMSLHARGVRVVTLEDSVGIEVANDRASIVPMRAVLNDEAFRNSKAELPVAIGYTIQQKVQVFDLADAPHLLVAGATKQGKSVGLNVIVASLLYAKHPSELKLVFIDPKMVEFSTYGRLLHHYLAVLPANDEQEEIDNAIVKKPDKASNVLKSLCVEMDQRYELLSKALVPNIKLYNEKYKNRKLLPTEGHRFLPYIVTIVDEYADLTMSVGGNSDSKAIARSITTSIIRLAQKGRAAGIHVVLATQRPSVDVITGLIKTNFPWRIAFRVAQRVDSSTIIDSPGAEKLIGNGDMLLCMGIDSKRIQCAYISSEEINDITRFIGDQQGYKRGYNIPYYLPSVDEGTEDASAGASSVDMKKLDERFEEAAKLVVMNGKASTSDLQRRLGMGFAKAGRVMDQLEAAGIVGPQEGSKPRSVLISDLGELDKIIEIYRK